MRFARFLATARPLGRDTTIESNVVSETNRLSKTLTKFWDKVTIDETNGYLALKLDSKPLRTPLGHPLEIPSSKRLLAFMVSHEWVNLPSLSIKPHSLPLTSVVSRSIDLSHSHVDTEMQAKVGRIDDICVDLLRYLDTDTLLVFSPAEEFEGALRKKQDELYLPIIKNMEEYLGVELRFLDSDVHGLRGNPQSAETREAVLKWLKTLNVWDLTAFEKCVLTTKSFLCGVALLRAKSFGETERAMTVEDIATAATLETIFQTERWGEVEDTHDVDKVDVRRNVAAAAIVAFN